MLSMWAKLGLDSSGFNRGLAAVASKTDATFSKLGNKTSKDLQNRFLKTFGVVGAAGLVSSGVSRVAQESRDSFKGATQAGLSVQDFEAANEVITRLGDTSNLTAEEFAELVKATKELRGTTNEEMLSRLEAADELADAQSKFKAAFDGIFANLMTSFAKVANFFRHIGAALSDIFTNDLEGTAGKAEAERQKKEEELRDYESRLRRQRMEELRSSNDPDRFNKLRGIDDEKKEKATRATTLKESPEAKIVTDAMARLGLFVGKPGAAPQVIQKQQLDELQGLRRDMKDLNRTVKEAI
jgi:hypothetical protein